MKTKYLSKTEMKAMDNLKESYGGAKKISATIEEKRKNEFTAVIDESNNLCGYIRFIENKDFVLVGLGLKPSLCGQGLGNILTELLKNECKKRYGSKKIALEVRSFNKRAIKCYEKAGFEITDVYQKDTLIGSDEFIKMEYKC